MKRFLTLLLITVFILLINNVKLLHAQCTNPSIELPDTSIPVDGDTQNAYCVTLSFDPAETGLPTGISMDIHHTWQGDLGIWILANGNYLNIVQRPGVFESCEGGCPCGNSAELGFPPTPSTYTFSDGGGPDPEDGMDAGGGAYGITADDGCGLGTPGIDTFADLWATYEPGEEITATLCISDHAGGDAGEASNITFLFPNPIICGCTDPVADNYDPAASVDDGTCEYSCPEFGTAIGPLVTELCAGDSLPFTLTATAPLAEGASYAWTGTNGGTAFLSNPDAATTEVNVPDGFTGNVEFNVTVTDVDGCQETAAAGLTVYPPPVFNIVGDESLCVGDSVVLQSDLSGSAYLWSTGATTPSVNVSNGGEYVLTLTDANGCNGAAAFTVAEYPLPTPVIQGPAAIFQGEEVTLRVTDLFADYFWSTTDNTRMITIDSPGVYQVTITDDNGCQGTAELAVAEEVGYNVYTPNAFSPNVDGVNDTFYFFSDQRSVARIVSLQVFDRWGGQVFDNTDFPPDDPEEGWDGTRNGQAAANGVYVWSAVVELANGELVQLQGDVLLLGR